MARGAAAAGAVMCLSTLATCTVEDVAAAAPDGSPVVPGLRVPGPRRHPGPRGPARRPPATRRSSSPRTCRSSGSASASCAIRHQVAAAAAGAPFAMAPSDHTELIDPDLRWSDIEQLAAESELPVLVKGVLAPQDAVLAAEHGAAGIIVSNHGGRQLDTAIAGADALPAVLDAVGRPRRGARRRRDPPRNRHRSRRSPSAPSAVLVGRPAAVRARGRRRRRGRATCWDPADGVRQRPRPGRDRGGPESRSRLDRGSERGSARVTMRILVTGTSGYVGSSLAPRLLRDGHEVRGMSRRGGAGGHGFEVVAADVVSGQGLGRALDSIDVAYYLIHSMEPVDRRRRSTPASAAGPRTSPRPPRPRACGGSCTSGASCRRARRPRSTWPAGWPSRSSCSRPRRLGRVPGLDRDRRPLELVPLHGPADRAGAVHPAPRMARQPHAADRRAGRDRAARARGRGPAVGGRSLDIAGPDVVTYGELIDRIRDLMLVGRPALSLHKLDRHPDRQPGRRGHRRPGSRADRAADGGPGQRPASAARIQRRGARRADALSERGDRARAADVGDRRTARARYSLRCAGR